MVRFTDKSKENFNIHNNEISETSHDHGREDHELIFGNFHERKFKKYIFLIVK